MAASATSATQPFLAFPVTQGFGQTGNASEPTVAALSKVLPANVVASLSGAQHYHTGVDYAAPSGTPIYAFISGTVTSAGWDKTGYGNRVEVATGVNGLSTLFGHLSSVVVQPGQTVQAGQLLGYSGSTGNSTGAHVHFSVLNQAGQYIDPIPVLGELFTGATKGGVVTTPDLTATQKFQQAGAPNPAAVASAQQAGNAQWNPATQLDFGQSIGHYLLQFGLVAVAIVLIVLGVVILMRRPIMEAGKVAAL